MAWCGGLDTGLDWIHVEVLTVEKIEFRVLSIYVLLYLRMENCLEMRTRNGIQCNQGYLISNIVAVRYHILQGTARYR